MRGLFALLLLSSGILRADAQYFQVLDVSIDAQGRLHLHHLSDSSSYYILYRGDTVDSVSLPDGIALGVDGVGELVGRSSSAGKRASFYRVEWVFQRQPLDLDGDGIDDVYELNHADVLNPLNPADALQDAGNGRTRLEAYQIASTSLTTVLEASPHNGEGDVAVTRRTIFRLNHPLAAGTSIDTSRLHAEFGGRRILSRVELSSDRQTATLFYLEPLPSSARIRVTFDGTGLTDFLDRAVDLDGDGQPGGKAVIDFDTLSITAVPGTAVIGHVYAAELASGGGNQPATNRPLAGVTITVDGSEETLRTTTDANGFFQLEPCPAGRFFVLVDGRTVPNVPAGAYYPFVGKAWEAVAGSTTNLAAGTGEIFLPLIADGTLQPVSATSDTVITFPAAVLNANPALAGVSITVPANSLYANDGTRGGNIGIAPVPPDRLPEPLPPGINPAIVITVQTDGPRNLDRPIPVRFPNLPDPVTGVKLPPGAKSALWSFNHDKGHWEVVGPMTVSADGNFVDTDPGVGILQPGWHLSSPGTSASGGPPLRSPDEDLPPLQFGQADPLPPLPPDVPFDPNAPLPPPPPPPKDPPCPPVTPWKRAKEVFDVMKEVADCLKNWKDVLHGVQCAVKAVKAFGDLGFAAHQLYEDISAGKIEGQKALSDRLATTKAAKDVLLAAVECYQKQSSYKFAKATFDCLGNFLGIATAICSTEDPGPGAPEKCRFTPTHQVICKNLTTLKALHTTAKDYVKILEATEEKLTQTAVNQVVNTLDNLLKMAINNSQFPIHGLTADTPLTPQQTEALLQLLGSLPPQLAPFDGTEPDLEAASTLFEQVQNDVDTALETSGRDLQENGHRQSARFYYAIDINGTTLRGVTSDEGVINVILGPDSDYTLAIYDPQSNNYGETIGRTAPNGAITTLGAVALESAATLPDADHNGVPDAVEHVVGIHSPTKAQLLALSPTAGILTGAPTPGSALDICVANNVAVVACGSSGVTLYKVQGSANPIRVGQVATPDSAQRVAYSGNLVGVAANAAGLLVLDVSDPGAAAIARQVKFKFPAQAIACFNGVAYVAATSGAQAELDAVDLNSGLILNQRSLPTPNVSDVAVADDQVFAWTDKGLFTFSTTLAPLGSNSVTAAIFWPARRIFAGAGFAYAGGQNAFEIFNVSSPEKPILVSDDSQDLGARVSLRQLVPLPATPARALAIAGGDLWLYDIATSSLAGQVAGGLNATALSVDHGLAYVATSEGLQVISFAPPDTSSNAPSIALTANFPLAPAQIVEGHVAKLLATASDDVIVREVEFYIDGASVAVDGSFPFEYQFVAPLNTNKSFFTLRAKATDSGGNETWTDEITVTVAKDLTPPQVLARFPADGAQVVGTKTLLASFDKQLNTATISALTFQLRYAGPDGVFDTSDDLNILPAGFEWRSALAAVVMNLGAPLVNGLYRATVTTNIQDLIGNKPASPVSWTFKVGSDIIRTSPSLAAGNYSTLVIKPNGALWSWGDNSSGTLALAVVGRFSTATPAQAGTDVDWTGIAAGTAHALALKKDGSLWTWGYNNWGQLGDGTRTSTNAPRKLPSSQPWVAMAGGLNHSLAIKADGSLWAWGNNDNGKLGDGSGQPQVIPVRVGTDNDWLAVAAGGSHSLALKVDGSLWGWGQNIWDQLGDATEQEHDVPTRIGTDTDWAQITAPAQGNCSFAIKLDGTLWAWGDNANGQLGDGTTKTHRLPARVGADANWREIHAGSVLGAIFSPDGFPFLIQETFAVGLKADGSIWAWGSNAVGQLGDGTTTDHGIPAQVGVAKDWKTLVTGGDHCIALKVDGTLWGWGGNGSHGQLGIFQQAGIQDSLGDQHSPVRIGALNDWGTPGQ